MNNNIEVLTQRIIGYNKKQVDEYIDEIRRTHQKRVSSINDSIEKNLQEMERLFSELSMIKSLIQDKENAKELLEFALKRSTRTIAFINRMTGEDIEKIIEDAKSRMHIHEKQAQSLEHNMEDQRTEIDQLLQKMQLLFHVKEKVEKINVKQKQEDEEEPKIDEVHESDIKKTNNNNNFENLLISSDWQKTIKNEAKETIGNPIPDKKENLDSELEKMTADGYSLAKTKSFSETKNLTDLLIKNEKNIMNELQDVFWDDGDDPTPKETAIPRLNNVVKLPGDIFNREKTIKENAQKESFYKGKRNDLGKSSIDDEKNGLIDELKNDNLFFEDGNNVPVNEFIHSNGVIYDKQESVKHQFEDKVEKMAAGESPKGSLSSTKEIENIRQMYMVGKVAGADLFDQKGNLVVAKNSIISPGIIKEAEREGLLVELALNMSLPRIE